MYAFTSFTWLDHAQRALRFDRPALALWCLRRALHHAQREGRKRGAGHILCAINSLRKA